MPKQPPAMDIGMHLLGAFGLEHLGEVEVRLRSGMTVQGDKVGLIVTVDASGIPGIIAVQLVDISGRKMSIPWAAVEILSPPVGSNIGSR